MSIRTKSPCWQLVASVAMLAAMVSILLSGSGIFKPGPVEAGGAKKSMPGIVRDADWYIRYVQSGGAADHVFRFGRAGDDFFVGDWNGDGHKTPGVRRGNTWYLHEILSGGSAYITFNFGRAGDIPIVGDWNGDGITNVGVVRGRTWYLKNSHRGGEADISFNYGRPGDIPVVGDWNGNGKTTIGIVRGREWHLKNSLRGGASDISFTYGRVGDTPIVGDWNGDGRTTVGVVRGREWHLKNSLRGGAADLTFRYGQPGDIPVVGNWTKPAKEVIPASNNVGTSPQSPKGDKPTAKPGDMTIGSTCRGVSTTKEVQESCERALRIKELQGKLTRLERGELTISSACRGLSTTKEVQDSCERALIINELRKYGVVDPEADSTRKEVKRDTESTSLRDRLVRVAIQEWEFWGEGTKQESKMSERIDEYWRVGRRNPNAVWPRRKPGSNSAWSAAFISWVVKEAGTSYEDFKYSTAHRDYISQAKENRETNQINSPFRAYRINEFRPRVGDLVCNTYGSGGATYDNIADGTFWETHCDIVVEVDRSRNKLNVIGGNVSRAVTKRDVLLDSRGFIDPERNERPYFAVIRVE